MRAETDQPAGNGDALRVGVGMDVGPTSGRVTRLVPFLNVIERVSVADRPVPRVLRLIG